MMKIALLLILISLNGCLEKPDTRLFQQAKKSQAAKDYKTAVELFEKLLQSTSSKSLKLDCAERLVYLYELQGEYAKKLSRLQFIVVNSTDRNQRVRAKQQMADTEFFKEKNYTSALAHYYELIQLGFNKIKNQLMVSRCYYYLNNFEQALFELEKILKNSKNADIRFESSLLKAHILFAQKKYLDSSNLYFSLIEDHPKASKENFVLLNLAMSYEEGGQYRLAVQALEDLKEFYHSPEFLSAKIHHIQKKIGFMPGGKGGLRR